MVPPFTPSFSRRRPTPSSRSRAKPGCAAPNAARLAQTMGVVRLTIVPDEIEAELVCSLLRTAGIESFHRKTDFAAAAWTGLLVGGPREILVRAGDLDSAPEVLAAQKHDGT